jgi:hypothetical protein
MYSARKIVPAPMALTTSARARASSSEMLAARQVCSPTSADTCRSRSAQTASGSLRPLSFFSAESLFL